jgi:hypothetical protein
LFFRYYNTARYIAFRGDINCLAYVLNIIVNDILNALIKEAKTDIDINDIENIRNERNGGAKVVIESLSKLYFLYFIY